jgi:hypothetical protein
VPATPEHPKTFTHPETWVYHQPRHSIWPAVAELSLDPTPQLSAPSALSFGFPHLFGAEVAVPAAAAGGASMVVAQAGLSAADDVTKVQWDWPPHLPPIVVASADDSLPLPDPRAAGWRGPLAPQLLLEATRALPARAKGDPLGQMIRDMARSERRHVRPGKLRRVVRNTRSATWSRKLHWIR